MTSAARRASLASSIVQQPARTGAVGLRVAREREVDAGDVVALLGGACCGHCRVDAARHRCQDSHQLPPLTFVDRAALRARSTTGAIASTSASTSAWVEVWPEREAQRGPRELLRGAHREQHVGGLGYAGVAGRSGRALDAARVEQHQQRVALAAGELQVRVAGQPVVGAVPRVAVVDRVRHLAAYAVRPGASRSRTSRAASSGWRSTASSHATANPAIAGGSMVPERMSRSWPPPCSRCGRLQLTAYDERADAVRATDLVPGDRHRVDPGSGEVERQLAECLDRVGVHRDAVGVRDLDDLGDRLHGADLVVGPHHRHQRDALGVGLDGGAERVDVEPALPVDRDELDLGALGAEPVAAGRARRGARSGVLRMRTRRGSSARRAQNRPLIARLSDSVPPEVNTTSPGRHLSARAIRSRDSSTTRRASRPEACSEDALPTRPSRAVIAAAASGRIGVVAAWSR